MRAGSRTRRSGAYGRMAGLTIIQLMLILLVAGIAGAVIVRLLIDERCKNDPQASICTDRNPGLAK